MRGTAALGWAFRLRGTCHRNAMFAPRLCRSRSPDFRRWPPHAPGDDASRAHCSCSPVYGRHRGCSSSWGGRSRFRSVASPRAASTARGHWRLRRGLVLVPSLHFVPLECLRGRLRRLRRRRTTLFNFLLRRMRRASQAPRHGHLRASPHTCHRSSFGRRRVARRAAFGR